MFKRIDHVVIAVSDLEAANAVYSKQLGLKGREAQEVPAIGIKQIIFDLGNAFIEVAQPITEASPLTRFLKERGEGIYLIAVQVDDVKATAKKLRANGARIIGNEDAGGQVFVHPKSTHGVLIQLTQ